MIVSFLGTKGGTGTTTLAVNCAADIRRHTNRSTIVVDLKNGPGDVALFLGLRPRHSLLTALDHLAWMLSDSTGVPPAFAKPAGMIQETYGGYKGAFLPGSQATKHDEDFVELWKTQKKRALPFRFGYVDMERQAHVVVTKPRPK